MDAKEPTSQGRRTRITLACAGVSLMMLGGLMAVREVVLMAVGAGAIFG
jgi:hypothetical protein